MDFKYVDKKYRPIPFWSWNERLDTEETKRQIHIMNNAGFGGYFMHARGGLQTEYMGKEWFDNISVGVSEGRRLNMKPWVYDENGWPSGFGSGKINGKGIKYQQKYLRCSKGEEQTENTIANINGYHFYYEVNPFYVDLMDKDVVKAFIDEIYVPYYEKFGNEIEGVFTDEPQLSRNGVPWSFVLPDEYKKEYGENIEDIIYDLFFDSKTSSVNRIKFWRLVTKLFVESFSKQVYEWCDEHNIKLTGHMVLEENLLIQLTSNGAVMPSYEYFHIPGVDWLGRHDVDKLLPLQVFSVAAQTGKKQVLTESFALCGWNVSFEELRNIYEQQMVRGVNLLCTHLSAYSIRGIRKRDFPASLYYQQPWWDKYDLFVDSMSRIGMLLTEGKTQYDTLVIHPQTTAWTMFNSSDNEDINRLNDRFLNVIDKLEQKHILFHLGDELMMERLAYVDGNEFVLGEQRYKTIVLDPDFVLMNNTKKLLDEFKSNGGKLVTVDEVTANDIIDNTDVVYTKRIFDDFDMYYFVNSTNFDQTISLKKGTAFLDIFSGELLPFSSNTVIPSKSSIVVLDYMCETTSTDQDQSLPITISGNWNIKSSDLNSYTLDYCKYSFDDELMEEYAPVITIQERACALKRKVKINMQFDFIVDYIPENIFLVCETPEVFSIIVNGKIIKKDICGNYYDLSFKKLDIKNYLKLGLNTIEMICDFCQSQQVYDNLEKARIFESEKNKLTYDMEIESIYLVGDFSLKTEGNFVPMDKNAVRYIGDFVISEPAKALSLNNIEQQGFPFFSGAMTLGNKFVLNNIENCVFKVNKKYANIISVKVNGFEVGNIVFKPYCINITPYVHIGENDIEITLINSLRNLLGPHHAESGELYDVTPPSFFKGDTVWGDWFQDNWNDGYCFVEFGVDLSV